MAIFNRKTICPRCEGSGKIPVHSRAVQRTFSTNRTVQRYRTTVSRMCSLCNQLGRVDVLTAQSYISLLQIQNAKKTPTGK